MKIKFDGKEFLSKHRHIIMSIVTFFIFIILSFSAYDSTFIYSKSSILLFPLIISIVFLFFVFIRLSFLNFLFLQVFFVIFIFAVIFFFIIYDLYQSQNKVMILLVQYISSLFGISSFIITLAIIYKIGYNYIMKLGGTSRIIIEIIFFIPCLINIFISYLLQQYSSTTNEILLLLALEAMLFIFYYAIYYIQYKNDKVINILSHVMFLDRKKIITTPCILFEDNMKDKSSDGRRRYSISLWISLNTEVSNHYSVPILQFAQNTPLITYEFDEIKKQNVITFQCGQDTVPEKSIIYITPQQWHNIIITYTTDKACIYCDGNIIRVISLEKNVPEYVSTDTLIIGSNKILNGAITDVNYFTYELNSLEVLGIYNINKNR